MSTMVDQAPQITNPFCTTSTINTPLSIDLCQQIHYTALRQAAKDCHLAETTVAAYLPELKKQARWLGPSVYLLHSDHIQRVFNGVSLSVYQTVDKLYCSRVGLTISMVDRILRQMASNAKIDIIDSEAIWAICCFLDERRKKALEVTVQRTDATWWLGQQSVNVELCDPGAPAYRPALSVIVDVAKHHVLALRPAQNADDTAAISLALYDALSLQRTPASVPDSAAGLCWKLPTKLMTSIDLPADCRQACQVLGIQVERTSEEPAFLASLGNSWTKDFASRLFTTPRFVQVFDTYIYRSLGSSPNRVLEEQQRTFAHLIGYNRDPSWQLPALRLLLPSKSGVIAVERVVAYDGLTYTHELLHYWPGAPVTIRQSAVTKAHAWIYLEGDLLCLAKARELLRLDGTYRSRR